MGLNVLKCRADTPGTMTEGEAGWLAGWLNRFNAELSPKRYRLRPKSQEVRKVSKLMFYAQSSSAVISGREWGKRMHMTMLHITLRCH